jgi:hypothetical protein
MEIMGSIASAGFQRVSLMAELPTPTPAVPQRMKIKPQQHKVPPVQTTLSPPSKQRTR